MNNTLRLSFLSALLSMLMLSAFAQEKKPAITTFTKKGRGVGFVTADSTFSLNFQFRMQNRAAFVSKSGSDLAAESYEMRVRRLRFKFEGFVYNPKLTYYIQLSMSRGDMDWRGPDNSTNNNSPNIVRDAVIYYNPTKHLRLGFGQTKLPGNRQRVISSGDQQFADRSIVNATFNIDRDYGFFAQYGGSHYSLRGAVTSGEGRNSLGSNNGLAYTGRVEILPFGKFTGTNDYQEGDLEREPKPKLSLATTIHFNDRAVRQAGTLGNDLYAPVNLRVFEADLLFKYKGWALYSEYMTRGIKNDETPITYLATDNSKTRHVYVGRGYLVQGSYLFKSNWEIAARWTRTTPFSSDFAVNETRQLDQSEFGVTKYLNGHRLKIQGNIVYGTRRDINADVFASDFWSGIFQIELGI